MQAMKLLTIFSPKLRSQMREVERQLRELVHVVDSFYDLLGPRHWVFHGQLETSRVATLLALREDEAERALIEI